MLRRGISIFVLFVAVVLCGWFIFSFSWGGKSDKQVAEKPATLEQQYADSTAKVEMVQSGAIVAASDHREIWVTVSRDKVVAEIVKGYDGKVIKRKVYKNSRAAFASFLNALQGLGYANNRNYTGSETEQGSCPAGHRYTYSVTLGGKELSHVWATSCSQKVGTFGGNLYGVNHLFEKQVPKYQDFVYGTML